MVIDRINIHSLKINYDSLIINGLTLLIDKELFWTSNDVVKKVQSIFKIKKVGHAGTLDPFATGLLIICLSKHTKLLNNYTNLSKEYTGLIKLGAKTISYDAEHPEFDIKSVDDINLDILKENTKKFIGDIKQYPPKFSAKKFGGTRQYLLSRNKIEFENNYSNVKILDFDIINYYKPFAEFTIKVSKGTYIRSVANDFGNELGVGGYLFSLRRTAIGNFNVENAIKISELKEIVNENILQF